MAHTDEAETACARFAGGFVPIETEVIVVVTGAEDEEVCVVRTTAQAAPGSPREAVSAVAAAYGRQMTDTSATVYVVVGGADGNKV